MRTPLTQRALPLLLVLLTCATGCSPSQKSGRTISTGDVTNAMPEFVLVSPPGTTNLYLRQVSTPQVSMAYLKLSVPRSSVTNFLRASGLLGSGEFIAIPAGTLPKAGMPPMAGLNPEGALAWAADFRHTAEWDLGKNKTPLLMTGTTRPALASPSLQVMATVMVEDSANPQATVYIEYYRIPKGR